MTDREGHRQAILQKKGLVMDQRFWKHVFVCVL